MKLKVRRANCSRNSTPIGRAAGYRFAPHCAHCPTDSRTSDLGFSIDEYQQVTLGLRCSCVAGLGNLPELLNIRFQVDGTNLTNIVNVIDFGELFSGNAIGPSRSVALRLTANF